MKTKIYYSISNNGDGSASPVFFLREEVAELHQQEVNLVEGWGEPCCGLALTIHSKTAPKIVDGLMTVKELIADLQEKLDDNFYGKEALSTINEVEGIISKLKLLS